MGVAALLVALAAAGWWIAGGRWMIVATPSMGQAAPVGTLVFTEQVTTEQVHVGDVVSFRSPLNPHEIYTHRVVSIDATGGLHTRGDINGAQDPSTLHTTDLVGKVVARWWGFGWLIRALPFLVVSGFVLALITRYASALWRRPLRIFGSSVLFAVAAFMLKPFVNLVLITSVGAPGGGTTATLVSTGLLPIRVQATGGGFLDLVDGQVGAVTASGPPGPHGYSFISGLHLSLGWWIAVILIWFTPLLFALALAPVEMPPPQDGGRHGGNADHAGQPGTIGIRATTLIQQAARTAVRTDSRTGRHRSAPVASGAGARSVGARSVGARSRHRSRAPRTAARRWVAGMSLALAAFLGFVPATESAFAAKINNSGTSTSTATYFTCAAAVAATAANATFFAYPLNETTFTTAADVSGNNRPGSYQTTGVTPGTFTSSTSAPCPRDLPSRAVTVAGGVTALGLTLGNAYIAGSGPALNSPNVFSEEIWFKVTSANAGGRLIGFGANSTLGPANQGTSNNYDRHIYMSSNGTLNFGVNPGTVNIISSSPGYADNNWHQVVATLSSAGMFLYIDGAFVISRPAITTGETITGGYWRVGYDNLAGWAGATANYNFNGTLAWASVYTTALSLTQIQQQYRAGIA